MRTLYGKPFNARTMRNTLSTKSVLRNGEKIGRVDNLFLDFFMMGKILHLYRRSNQIEKDFHDTASSIKICIYFIGDLFPHISTMVHKLGLVGTVEYSKDCVSSQSSVVI